MSILNPPVTKTTYGSYLNASFINNQSLVMRLQFKNITILLTGDVEKEGEERMVRKNFPLRAHILKIPHHGSSSSSSPIFLDRVKPDYAILSVGERNIARLPHPEVLKRYLQLDTSIFRTDRHGAITVVTDGENIEIRPFLSAKE